ncbi:MAG: hypothetical protein AAF660_04020 [Pseudomonadota bacterium]
MLILLRTFFDIALLRQGPEQLPRLTVFLVFAALFWLSSILLTWFLLDDFTGFSVVRSIVSNLLSLFLFTLFIAARGRAVRLTQMYTAILGATAYIAFATTAFLLLLQPTGNVLVLGILASWAWSVQVEGSIVSRTADVSLAGGVAVAAFVLIVQLLVNDFLIVVQQTPSA